MATLNLVYSTGAITLTDLNNTLALEFNYQENIPDPNNPGERIPNPETKTAFNHRMIGLKIKEAYWNQKKKAAREAAEAEVLEPPIGFK
jgi:hypothetical protein